MDLTRKYASHLPPEGEFLTNEQCNEFIQDKKQDALRFCIKDRIFQLISTLIHRTRTRYATKSDGVSVCTFITSWDTNWKPERT